MKPVQRHKQADGRWTQSQCPHILWSDESTFLLLLENKTDTGFGVPVIKNSTTSYERTYSTLLERLVMCYNIV